MQTTKTNAPIIGLLQDERVRHPRGIRLRKAHVGWDFDIHNDPRGGSPVILWFEVKVIATEFLSLPNDRWWSTYKHTKSSPKFVWWNILRLSILIFQACATGSPLQENMFSKPNKLQHNFCYRQMVKSG